MNVHFVCQVAVMLVAMNFLLVVSQPAKPSPTTFAFYKLALQWPSGVCASTINCTGGIPKDLTIHGLWPQDARDIGVPAYGKNNSCSSLTVVTQAGVENLLNSTSVSAVNLVKQLTQAWPDLKDITNVAGNKKFWSHEWANHGMCSDYGDKPVDYFTYAIDLRKNIVSALKFKSGTVRDIAETVYTQLNGRPEINCVTKGANKLLREMRLCYNKGNPTPQGIFNCTSLFSGTCTGAQDSVTV